MDVVLVEPQIPQNTGSIARTCAATDTPLHLVGQLGFDISEKKVRRAGLDYWPYVKLFQHTSWEQYIEARNPPRVWLFSAKGKRFYTDVEYGPDDALIFGSETKGLGDAFLSRYPAEQIVTIPMTTQHVRSLNLSNSVAIAMYEARRQLKLDLPHV
jgi:tRNA (cytidine/uridine-2'-O-)-methyltransferase